MARRAARPWLPAAALAIATVAAVALLSSAAADVAVPTAVPGISVVVPDQTAAAAAVAAINAAAGIPPSALPAPGAFPINRAALPPGAAPNGTVADLWRWWGAGGGRAPAGAKPAFACLAEAFKGPPRDRKVYSQWGEDGIIEAIFGCIGPGQGPGSLYYVEFGTQTCQECTSRYLRTKGWKGLLMDGSNEDASINLHKEYMRSDNIAGLFKKYSVPFPTFDHMTADLDLNTPHVLRAVLGAGYRPRSVAVEYNRNFHPTQSYAVLDLPNEVWQGGCYYSASALAFERLMRAHGYSLVAFDEAGVNLFFVLDAELGAPAPHSFAGITPDYGRAVWQPMMGPCKQTVWSHVEAAPALASPEWMRHFRPVVLSHGDAAPARGFYEAAAHGALALRRHRRHAAPLGGAAAHAGERRRQRRQ
ncbi:MAG: hypothetical protein J3K34DRAFT_156062 [Monoraphidium minutum]|nr:MAG: hypothetical protein J3K34DRAFT_156062 [Monoraphidium minutum]